jgi:hypothetical protein
VRPMHREVDAGFIEEDQALAARAPHPLYERLSSRVDVGPVHFLRPAAFFLTT